MSGVKNDKKCAVGCRLCINRLTNSNGTGKKWYESWYDMTLSEYMYIMECQHFSNFRNRFIITNLRKNQTFLNLNKS